MSADQDRRTIEPTPERIRKFRKRGEIGLSRELTQTTTMLAGAAMLAGTATWAAPSLGRLVAGTFADLSRGALPAAARASEDAFLDACVPVALAAVTAYLLTAAYQLGFPPAFGRLKVDLLRPFKLSGLKQLVSPQAAAWRATKAVLRLAFVAGAATWAVSVEKAAFMERPALNAGRILERYEASFARVFAYAGFAMLLLAVVDLIVARRRIHAKMRMTPEELKREMREQEGDPHIKRQRRRRMRELAQRRLTAVVPEADVVIINPTHYAVALRYDAKQDDAPKVVAKGKNRLAARIRELARKSGVPILEKPPLARLLYRTVPEGAVVPPGLYQAVAEVLAFVYRVRSRVS